MRHDDNHNDSGNHAPEKTPPLPALTQTGGGSLAISAAEFEAVLGSQYSEEDAETLRFWFFLARNRGWGLSALAKATGASTTVLSRLFRGVYPADGAQMMQKLRRARDNFAEAAENPDFIETSLARRLFAICDKTRSMRNISILWGAMGIGKTECVGEYQRQNNHGSTQVVRFPTGATFAYFVSHVARSCGVAARSQSAFEQRGKILQVLGAGQRLLIIDECHQAFLTTRADTAVKCCEYLREISDVAGCGMVLIGTEVLEKHIFHGQHKEALRQLVDRGTMQIPLPAKATKADYGKFLGAYGLTFPGASEPEAAAILGDIVRAAGLRKLTLHLRDGAAYAARREEPYAWEHFVSAFDAIQSLSKH